MLNVRVIRKLRGESGELIGYTILDEANNKTMNVYKQNLKEAVKQGKVNVVNMTLTSDGRLLGRAGLPIKKRPTGSGVSLLEVYTNGKRLVSGLIDETVLHNRIGTTHPTEYKGLNTHYNFEVGQSLIDKIGKCHYDNVNNVNDKPDTSQVKRKSFSKVKDKLIKIVKDNGINFGLKVEKSTNKYEYAIIIEGYEGFSDLEPIVNIIYSLIEDACITNKIKVLHRMDGTVYVENVTGIADVRKALKAIK